MQKPRVILIGNYLPDNQASMALFEQWLSIGLREQGWKVESIRPGVKFARGFESTLKGLGKWCGYIDKFILFPRYLRKMSSGLQNVVYHVVDHSNAVYASCLPRDCTLLTCHDVLAIEGAFGNKEAFCPASKTGLILQKWILRHLERAPRVAFVSNHTFSSYRRLSGKSQEKQIWQVIPNGLNQILTELPHDVLTDRLSEFPFSIKPNGYFLHVGSSLPRKNRIGVLRAFAQWKTSNRSEIRLIFAGKPLSAPENEVAIQLGLVDDISILSGFSTQWLEALYNGARALIFPSFSEGFGWPIIEAQSCGCPVISGDRSVLPEVSGEGALSCDPYSYDSIASAMAQLENPEVRNRLVAAGKRNLLRFSEEKTRGAYMECYSSMHQQMDSTNGA